MSSSDSENKRHLARGFNWLGSAMIIARVTDFVTIILVLTFLTKAQVGVASLVLAVAMVIEAFDGLGTGDALIQAKTVNDQQLHSLFWFIMALAVFVGLVAEALSPLFGWIYGISGMPLYFGLVALKQPLVGGAVISMATLNRELRYEKIAIINVTTTFGAALVRLGIAMAGGGSWALIGGYFCSGLFILCGALWASPYKPRLYFHFSSIRSLLSFGWRSASANIFDQAFKNVDSLLVGWFYGAAILAAYRVAFSLAMEPASAISALVNRTALPVFARVIREPEQLRGALLWSMQRLVTLTAPCIAGLALMAVPLCSMLHDAHGKSYLIAALPLQILSVAAMLRVITQLVTPVLMSAGRPGTVATLSFTTLSALSGSILVIGFLVRGPLGVVAVSVAWLAIYPLLLVWVLRYLRTDWLVSMTAMLGQLAMPAAAVLLMILFTYAARVLPYGDDNLTQVIVVSILTALAYVGLIWYGKRKAVQR